MDKRVSRYGREGPLMVKVWVPGEPAWWSDDRYREAATTARLRRRWFLEQGYGVHDHGVKVQSSAHSVVL